MRLFHIDRLSWKLGLSIATLVVTGQVIGFVLVYHFAYQRLLDATRQHAMLETGLVRQALEYQMLEKDKRLIRSMVRSFASDPTFRRVMILDREGVVKFSSDPSIQAKHFSQNSPTCRGCHHQAELDHSRAVLLQVDGGQLLRCVQPIPNQPICHRCHDASHRINGLIVADLPIGETTADMQRSITFLALSTSFIGLLLLAGIGLVVRRLVLRRLLHFESATRDLARGNLQRRVQVEGDDALTRVEEQFNHMADELTRMLSELTQQRASLERVMNSVDDGMVVLDRNRVIVAANGAYWRRFPGRDANSVGCKCYNVEDGGLGCTGDGGCPTVQCFASGQVQTVIRTRSMTDGSQRQEEVRASPVFDNKGHITHVVEVWRDITDRRSAEAQLAEYQRLVSLGMLASGFSHEVNTPLASIGTCLDGVQRLCEKTSGNIDVEAKTQVEEYTRVAREQVQRAGGITQQFLQLSRGGRIEDEVVDLVELTRQTARLCKPTAKESGVTVQVADSDGLPSVIANNAAVQQVLLNLMLNGVQASQPGSVLAIDFEIHDEAIDICVQDQGRGIEPADLERIFEPFFSRREKGTGLGLFVSMNLARGWEGDILVDSTPGQGSAFRLRFPRRQADEESGHA